MNEIELTCSACGESITVDRLVTDPPNAVKCVTNGCDRCHDPKTGNGTIEHYNADGECVLRMVITKDWTK